MDDGTGTGRATAPRIRVGDPCDPRSTRQCAAPRTVVGVRDTSLRAEPRFREVTINGRRYGQGERVEGMLLSEITPTGVVFQHAGYTFSVSVLEDWNY